MLLSGCVRTGYAVIEESKKVRRSASSCAHGLYLNARHISPITVQARTDDGIAKTEMKKQGTEHDLNELVLLAAFYKAAEKELRYKTHGTHAISL